MCFSLPSVADSGGAQGWFWQVWGPPGRERQLAEVNTGDIVRHEHKHCAAVDKGFTSVLSCHLHLKNELKNGV